MLNLKVCEKCYERNGFVWSGPCDNGLVKYIKCPTLVPVIKSTSFGENMRSWDLGEANIDHDVPGWCLYPKEQAAK